MYCASTQGGWNSSDIIIKITIIAAFCIVAARVAIAALESLESVCSFIAAGFGLLAFDCFFFVLFFPLSRAAPVSSSHFCVSAFGRSAGEPGKEVCLSPCLLFRLRSAAPPVVQPFQPSDPRTDSEAELPRPLGVGALRGGCDANQMQNEVISLNIRDYDASEARRELSSASQKS